MTTWLRPKSVQINPSEDKSSLHLDLTISPYDRPEAFRTTKTTDGLLRIEFRYRDGDEEPKEPRREGAVSVIEGRYSDRILAIEIDVEQAPVGKLTLKLARADDKDQLSSALNQLVPSNSSNENAQAIRGVLLGERETLLAQLQ